MPLDFSDLTGKGKKKEFTPQYSNDKEGALPKHIEEKANLVNKALHQRLPHQARPQPLEELAEKEVSKKNNHLRPLGYPVEKTKTGDELMQLFPTPLLICPYPVDYSKELEWIKNAECRKDNRGGGGEGNIQHYNRQSEDTYVLDKPELANIRAFIEAKLHEYASKILASDDKLVITQSWLNKSQKGESHHEHVHPNSIVSGVWYPQIHEQMPPIQFRS